MPESDYVVTAGFTDWHVHSALTDVATLETSPITRVLDLGSDLERVVHLSANTATTTVLYSGPFLTVTGGYPSDRNWAESGSYLELRSLKHAESAVANLAKSGVSIIKVSLNQVAGPVLDSELLRAVTTVAALKNLKVVVHAEGLGAAERARLAGASMLAHTPFTELLSATEIAAQADSMIWISTLDIHGYGEHTAEYFTALQNLRAFYEAGGRVLYGTDMGNGPTITGINGREIMALREAGMKDQDILFSLTGEGLDIAPVSQHTLRVPLTSEGLNFAKATRVIDS